MQAAPAPASYARFFKAVGAVTSLRGLGGALLFACQILLAGWMGPEAFGQYSFAWAWVAVLSTAAGLGFTSASVRFIAGYRAVDETARVRGLLRFGRALTLGVACAAAAIGCAAVTLFAPESPYRDALRLAFLAVPIVAFLQLESAYARGFHWMALSSVAEQIGRPVVLIAAGWATANLLGETSAEGFVLACVFAYGVATAGQHFAVRSRVRKAIPPGPSERETRAWLRVSLAMFLVSGSQMIRMNTDLVMLGLYLEPEDVGIYAAALRTSTLVSLAFLVTGVVAQPTISSMYAQGRRAELQAFVRTASRWIFAVSLALCVVVLSVGDLLLGLFGAQFVAGSDALRILALGHVAVAVLGPSTAVLAMTGHQNSAARIHAFAAVGGIALNAALIPAFGTVGAAIATAANLILMHVALFVVTRRNLGISPAIFGRVSEDARRP